MTQSWQNWSWKLGLVGIVAVCSSWVEVSGWSDRVLAQIIPDKTLGAEASVVTPNVEIKGLSGDRIDGGALRDSNLFHSFEQFNIGNGERVYFANPAGITNIFSRVTGSNLSEILGTLGVNGNANLFLINPNGIIFGENASLDVGGSFAASTANAIQFGERGFFSATEPEQPPLLTVKPSAFLFNQINPGRIENRSTAPAGVDLLETPLSGLRVSDGNSLLLLGGDIAIDRGGLHALGGQLELAGVAENGTVGLNIDGNNLSLSFPEDLARADISLTNEAFVNTSGEGGGEIGVWGRQVKLCDGCQIAAITLGAKAGRGLTVNASELVELAGTTVELTGATANNRLSSGLFTQTGGRGDAGNLTINTKHLRVENGARVLADTLSQGNAGNLTVNASESIQMIGAARMGSNTARPFFNSRLRLSRLVPQTSITGKGGNLTIMTKQLRLLKGSQISVDTEGGGDAGSLTVNAESVQVIGESDNGEFGSSLSSQASSNSTGNAGDLKISTTTLLISDGAQVGSGTFAEGSGGNLMVDATESVHLIGTSADGQFSSGLFTQTQGTGDAGNLKIITPALLIADGARVSASTFGEGDGGNLTVDATESVQLIGVDSVDGIGSSGLFTVARETGNAGELKISTERLTVRDGAEVSVSSRGLGVAGNLEIQSRSLSLDNQGAITATTRSGDGGDITLKGQDLLLLRRGSQISTTAGTAESGGDGGDINIAADLIVSFPQENSDITANAFRGNGGNININTQNIFGFQLQENPNLSDITASSQFGLDGTVNINTSGIEPGQELIELPIEIVDVSKLINQNLCLAGQEGEFIITGKGGLSPSPQDTLNTDAGWEDWRIVEDSESKHQESSQTELMPEANDRDPNQIIEAQSWFIAPNGKIVLSAQPVKSVSRSSFSLPFNCQLLDELKQ